MATNSLEYLTKEQIEAEGWESCATWFTKDYPGITTHSGEYFLNGVFVPYGHSELFYNFETLELTIQDIHGDTVFKGRCPDVNTLRYISKLVGV